MLFRASDCNGLDVVSPACGSPLRVSLLPTEANRPDGGGSGGGQAVAEEEDLMASVTARVGAALRNPQVRLAAAELEGIQKHKAIIDLRLFEEGNDGA